MPALLDLMKAVGKERVAYRIHADALDYTVNFQREPFLHMGTSKHIGGLFDKYQTNYIIWSKNRKNR